MFSLLQPPPPPKWQRNCRRLVRLAERVLWSADGEDACTYLRERGLTDKTIKAAHLGYDPEKDAIMIPWTHGKILRKVSTRRLSSQPRYANVDGSVGGTIYPDVSLLPGQPALLVEGEFDCLLVRQMAGNVVQAVTLGSVSSQPTPETLVALALCSPFLVGLDADRAGDKAAKVWARLAPRSKWVRPPKGKDWTDSHLAGVNLPRWLQNKVNS